MVSLKRVKLLRQVDWRQVSARVRKNNQDLFIGSVGHSLNIVKGFKNSKKQVI